jgi:phage protein D/phage baseplate assembly protein gpV
MPTKYLTQFTIKINGSEIAAAKYNDVNEIMVDTSLNMPSMCTIRFNDEKLAWADDASLDLGKALEISVKTGSNDASLTGLLFKGEITSLEPQFTSDGHTMMQVRGYDKSHRLHRGCKTRTFLKTKDSDLASTIGGEAGLSVEVDATTFQYDYVMQFNQTNWEFLVSRAERIGYQVICGEGKLLFKKADYSSGTTSLVFMMNLLSFEPRWASTHQTDKMIVKGWDVATKQAITGTKTPLASFNQGGMAKTGGAYATAAYSAADAVLVDQNPFNQSEADQLATGLSYNISRAFVEAEGVCEGNPGVKAGSKVNITKVGTRFSGTYMVTSATHTYSVTEGYLTHFSISGRHPQTLASMVNGDSVTPEVGRVSGFTIGIVTNLTDPDDLGRVKVKYPTLGEIESDWVRIASPMAGSGRGFMFLPEINDEVVVAFQNGDIHRPCIVGSLWSKVDKPPVVNSVAVESGKVNQRMIKTRAGHIIMLDDKQGEEKISVKSKSGHEIIMDDKSGSESVTIKDKTGSNSMVIKSSDNSMAIKVQGDFSVTATGKITLKSTQDMTLESTANAKLKGIQLALEGTAQAEMKAPTATVNGSAMTEIKSGATTVVKGGAMVQVQGALVTIN